MHNRENEEELTLLLTQGDYTAFTDIYLHYSKPLYIFLFHKLQEEEVCNDVLQDIFIALWEKRGQLQISTSLRSYLFQMARFKVIDIYRKNAHYRKYLSELGRYAVREQWIQGDAIDQKRRLTEVMTTINHFPEKMREIFILSRFEHLPVDSIADRLSLSSQTVKNQLSKALRILRTNHVMEHLVIGFLFILLDC